MSRCSTLLKSQAGQSELLGLIIASAIGAIVIAATTTSFVELNKGQSNITQTADAVDIKRELEQMLTEPKACERNFAGLTANGAERATALDSVDKDGAVTEDKYPVAQAIPGFKVRMQNWNLANDIVIFREPGSGKVQQIVILNVNLTKEGDVSGAKSITRKVKLWSQKVGNENTAIETCYAITGTGSEIWLRHANQNDIYNGHINGLVGVGTDTPLYKFHVTDPNDPLLGDMRATGPVTAKNFVVNGNFLQTGASTNSVLGRFGFRTNAPTVPMDVNGDFAIDGAFTVGGVLSAPDANVRTSLAVGTNLTVGGTSTFASTAVNGDATYQNSALFQGDARIDGPATMAQTYSVLGGSVGTNTLGVRGIMITNDLVTVPRVNADRFCINGDCRTTFVTQTCQPGFVAYQNVVTGQVNCADISCPAGTFFRGMNGTAKDCQALPTATCPTNAYITDYDAVTGIYTCRPIPPEVHVPNCTSGYLVGVNNGVPVCLPPQMVGGVCGVGRVVMQINSDGTVVCDDVFKNASMCAAGTVMTGMTSNGTVVCGNKGNLSSCNTDGQVVSSMSASRTATCGSVSIAGGACAGGIKAISSTGAVTCF